MHPIFPTVWAGWSASCQCDMISSLISTWKSCVIFELSQRRYPNGDDVATECLRNRATVDHRYLQDRGAARYLVQSSAPACHDGHFFETAGKELAALKVPDFIANLSILDMMFNIGPKTREIVLG